MAEMNYAFALFKWCLPKDKPKAILVLVPGSNGDGRGMVDWDIWQNFANDNQVALVGCYYQDIDPSSIEGYTQVNKGSGQALMNDIRKQGLSKLPILLWGHSAGGQFNYEFACWQPTKVIGFIVNKGGYYYTALAPELTRKIPSLWFMGNYDAYHRRAIISGLVAMNRSAGAVNWVLKPENCGHDLGDSIEDSIEFFKEILSKL